MEAKFKTAFDESLSKEQYISEEKSYRTSGWYDLDGNEMGVPRTWPTGVYEYYASGKCTRREYRYNNDYKAQEELDLILNNNEWKQL